MTTPIDTTRLRERAEAVRDAGVKSTYAHHVVKRLVDAGHSDLTSAHKDAREAAETLRGAQKRLYRDAPPDGIIIALLDEVERLRALRELAQRKLDGIAGTLDMCSWGDDEAWQIQCHMDDLVEIINAAGGSAERVMFATENEEDGGPDVQRVAEPEEGGTR